MPEASLECPIKPLDHRRVAIVKSYVEEHLDRMLNIDELADVACQSRSHFSRSFKAATGKTPAEYVAARRLDRAMTLLSDSDISINGICHSLGFSSQANFTRGFRRKTGTTPKRYRILNAE
jgi:AraC family transcriptional regulator